MPNPSNSTPYWNAGGPRVYSEADLTGAIDAGILPPETAIRLKQHVLGKQLAPQANEEFFRLVGGFSDIFVTIASIMLMGAVLIIFTTSQDNLQPFDFFYIPTSLPTAIVAWGLAEYFVRIKRLSLTAIVLLFAFVGGVTDSTFKLAQHLLEDPKILVAIAGLVSTLAAWLHWKRFGVPITVVCGVGAAITFIISTLLYFFPPLKDYITPLLFILGIGVFTLAMYWDSSDIDRQTRRTDIAFWLHLLAAPLLVHPIFIEIGVFEGNINALLAVVIILLYLVVAFISLCIDRRALMVSALSYVLYAFTILFYDKPSWGGYEMGNFATSALIVSIILLVLAALWQPARVWALNKLPKSIQEKLPPAHIV